ncbi:MAG: peroxiredoxin family protein [Steroidobacteraceae bacterium]
MHRVHECRRRLVTLVLLMASAGALAANYPLIGQPAPDFALRAFAGSNVRLSEHRGEVVVLAFWSSDCSTCGSELAAINRSYSTYRTAGLTVFGIGVEDSRRHAREFVRAHRVGFQMLDDPAEEVSRLYAVDSLPMAVLIDRNGTIRDVDHDFGPRDEARYRAELRRLLDE